jgi:hypothetical protein
MVEYFVSYISGRHIGNAKVTFESDTISVADVRRLEKALEEKYKQKAVILNLVKLREE